MLVKKFLATTLLLSIAACSIFEKEQPTSALPAPSLEKIAGGVWIHKSYKDVPPWGPVLSQGLVVRTEGGVVLVDTAWTDEETETLLSLIERDLGETPDIAIITHAHEDKMGGMKALQEHGIGGRAHPLTNEDATARGLRKTMFSILDGRDREMLLGAQDEQGVTVFYPGPGHTRDNIVVYYAPAKVLFGGCLIRPGGTDNLGNTADADIGHWAKAVRNVAAAFPDAEIVIPSHGPMGGRELLDHTIALAEAAAQ
ncbi:subclass B1 metallo-beta-lactamase [Hyphococcus sp.]|uniref:subclass B1 metallo-beta-lactamase n=1 Tax=Hyphococcus sp. TaxID=2038636 RepID=UPI00208B8EF1|nr:MAG: beta-lactamase [Marinicaulis sp.]